MYDWITIKGILKGLEGMFMTENEKSNGLNASSNLSSGDGLEVSGLVNAGDSAEIGGSETEKSSDQSFADLLKKFRAQSAGIISEFRRKSAYIPASVRRAEKQAKARSRSRKK